MSTITKKPKSQKTPSKGRRSANEIAEDILLLIHAQEYQPGDRITEQEIANRFNVSRSPVREALRILEAKTAIRIEPMKGATVVRMSDEETIVSVEMSGVLFGLAARRATELATKDDITEIQAKATKLIEKARSGMSAKDFFKSTVVVGAMVIKAASSTVLADRIRDIRIGAPTLFGPLGFLTEEIRVRAAENWVALAQALQARDHVEAERLANTIHLDACQNALEVAF